MRVLSLSASKSIADRGKNGKSTGLVDVDSGVGRRVGFWHSQRLLDSAHRFRIDAHAAAADSCEDPAANRANLVKQLSVVSRGLAAFWVSLNSANFVDYSAAVAAFVAAAAGAVPSFAAAYVSARVVPG